MLSINAKHCHTSPAGRILRNICIDAGYDTAFVETTINNNFFEIFQQVVKTDFDFLFVGVYIWNLELVLKLVKTLKELKPSCIITLAGPEVSFSPKEFLQNDFVDYILCGESEEALPLLIEKLQSDNSLTVPAGVACRNSEAPYSYALANFTKHNVGYYTDEEIKSGRLLYFETSRGCPYNCSYCVSSAQHGVRFLETSLAIEELIRLGQGGGTIKILDRTFNADKSRALEIWQALANLECSAVYHFEICAKLLDNETIKFLKTVPTGRFQFEIGIQSTNKQTLDAIYRFSNTLEELEKISQIKNCGNINVHLDLIAGLPYESYNSFVTSFNLVYPNSHVLQLGFLKMLRGTRIMGQVDEFGYLFTSFPPYEILKNELLSFDEICKLKTAENALELFSNSAKFKYSLPILLKNFTPFELFLTLGEILSTRENPSQKELFTILHSLAQKHSLANEYFLAHLRADYTAAFRGSPPVFLKSDSSEQLKKAIFDFYRKHELLYQILPHLSALSPKEIEKNTDICEFIFNKNSKTILLFDRKYGKIVDITKFLEE